MCGSSKCMLAVADGRWCCVVCVVCGVLVQRSQRGWREDARMERRHYDCGGSRQIAERRAFAQKQLFPEKFKPKLAESKGAAALDLTDELDEEERLRVEAAEWVPCECFY